MVIGVHAAMNLCPLQCTVATHLVQIVNRYIVGSVVITHGLAIR